MSVRVPIRHRIDEACTPSRLRFVAVVASRPRACRWILVDHISSGAAVHEQLYGVQETWCIIGKRAQRMPILRCSMPHFKTLLVTLHPAPMSIMAF